MDSGDTGTEEVAKKRFNQLLPCSSSCSSPFGGHERRKKRLSRSPRLLLALGAYAQACVSGDHGQELGGSTLSKERLLVRGDATQVVGRSEARGGLRSTCKLPSQEGLPGAHVLAVVPAHRGTYAEVRGRCWLQISSRNALQKQRQTRVNGGLGDSLFRELSRGSGHRRGIATPCSGGQKPLRGGKAQGGVMSVTRRFGLSREDRVACLARCPVRKTRHVRDESIGRVLTNGSCSGLRTTALFTDGLEEVASVDTQCTPRPVMYNHAPVRE